MCKGKSFGGGDEPENETDHKWITFTPIKFPYIRKKFPMRNSLIALTSFLCLLFLAHTSIGQTSFSYTGAVQTYTVPSGVTRISVDVWGAGGGISYDSAAYPDRGGWGGRVQALMAVTPGMVLNIYVGGKGSDGAYTTGGGGGYNGGGYGGEASWGYSGGGGGGGSDIRTGSALTSRLIVAGGGGGAGAECSSFAYYPDGERGGDGGNDVGESGGDGCYFDGGHGASDSAGGAGGYNIGSSSPAPGIAGSLGSGGGGGTPSTGGGGGGGYYGGGGGDNGGGGGGSSWVDSSLMSTFFYTRGYNDGDGLVIISTTLCTVTPTVGHITGSGDICTDGEVTYTDATAAGHWSVVNNDLIMLHDGTVIGRSSGTDTIIYTVSNACGATSDSLIVTVDTSRYAGTITGSSAVCVSDSLTLTDGTPGGVWSSGAIDTATISVRGEVRGLRTGVVLITYALSNGCHSVWTMTVNGSPSAISGLASVCAGATTRMTNLIAGGTWSSGSIGIATIVASTGVVTGVGAGTVAITYSLPTGCSAVQVLTVDASPVPIAPFTSICTGGVETLTDATASGTWSSSNISVATVGSATGSIAGVAAGTARVTYLLPDGCLAHAIVTVNPMPAAIAGLSTVCEGGELDLSDATIGGVWASSNTGIATVISSSGIVTGVSAGTVVITYTIAGCDTTATIAVDSCSGAYVGQVQQAVDIIAVAPNPTTGAFMIAGDVAPDEKTLAITVADLLGRTIHQETVHVNNGKVSREIMLGSDVPAGVYIVKLSSLHTERSLRIVIER
jgi:Glycine rich protein/Secretion system C-terminal sorting domain